MANTAHAARRSVVEWPDCICAVEQTMQTESDLHLAEITAIKLRTDAIEGRVPETQQAADPLDQLRKDTAWVDPAVQLWNRSLFFNLCYGNPDRVPTANLLEQSELRQLLEKLPDGLQTELGESGGLVSGGEGQRVRFGRALLRREVRLALLDEPFRGLDRHQRRALLARARRHWESTTLMCVTHDVSETLGFPRALVVENGRIVEDGNPAELARQADSRYRALLEAEESVREGSWSSGQWRHLRLEDGRLSEELQRVSV